MSATTGPILAIGAITVTNSVIFNDREMDWRPVVATGLAVAMFAGAEKVWADGAKMLAYTALVAVCLSRIQPDVPSPVESALKWWNSGGKSSGAKQSSTTGRAPVVGPAVAAV